MKTENKLKQIFSEIFKLEIDEINRETSPNNCSAWDSFNMVKLIIAIEKEFDITISIDEVIEFRNFSDILNNVEKKSK